MSKAIQDAMSNYKAGRFDLVASQLGIAVRGMKTVDTPVALLLAQSCFKLGRLEEAAGWYEKAAVNAGANADQINLLAANLYWRVKKADRSLSLTRTLLARNARNIEALSLYRNCLRFLLLFSEMEQNDRELLPLMQAGDATMLAMERPLDNVFWCTDEAVNARVSRMDDVMAVTPQTQAARRAVPHAYGDRIRVGYLSNDVSDQHATMRLIQGVFLAHDRAAFDITVFCHTDDGVIATDRGMRSRYDRLVRIGHLSDADAVKLIRESGIDILVDLKGHTRDSRLNILNRGAAPIQVAYLGYPGFTTGIDVDYIIGDAVVTPDSSKPFHAPKICRLPESYQSNDDTYRALPQALTRAELGLPDGKVVFASFNSTLKISAQTFRLWVEILSRVKDSVLWIMVEHPMIRDNLIRQMAENGIEATRIIFAGRADYPEHVARLQAADIGLDTFPCNGHTTTSDKLWAGLPVVTYKGSNFASRVSESLLKALDMPDLVAEDAEGYVALSIELAENPQRLADIKTRIAANRFHAPLFDTERFTRHLESAYRSMVERARNGMAPDHIDIPALPARQGRFKSPDKDQKLKFA